MPQNNNFFELIQQQILASSQKTFLELHDSRLISFSDANRLSAQLANKLNELGLQPGDRVTAQTDKSAQAVLLYLACIRAGLIFHPLNTAYTLKELDYFLEDAQPMLFVCGSKRADETTELIKKHKIQLVETLEANGTGTLCQDIAEYEERFETVVRDGNDTALLIYTSGTTGKPKGAMITHENISSNAASLSQVWGWQKNDVLLHVLPIFHVHGLCVALHIPLLMGTKILFQPRFSVTETIKLLPQTTVMMAVPTIYTRLLSDVKFKKDVCDGMRLFVSGSAPLLPETFTQFEQRTGHRILERYGMSEAQMITSNPLHGVRRGGTVGFPLPGVHVRVCDDDGRPLECGEVGALEIKGPNVFRGYWCNPDATKSTFREDGYFITGDVARIDEEGVVTIVGREKDLIISAGFNIYPSEIEFQINQIPLVSDSAVFGVPHPDLGEGVVAAVIRQSDSLSELQISEFLEKNLSAFKIPRQIVFVDEFPRNAMGKIEKNRLRESYRSVFSDEGL